MKQLWWVMMFLLFMPVFTYGTPWASYTYWDTDIIYHIISTYRHRFHEETKEPLQSNFHVWRKPRLKLNYFWNHCFADCFLIIGCECNLSLGDWADFSREWGTSISRWIIMPPLPLHTCPLALPRNYYNYCQLFSSQSLLYTCSTELVCVPKLSWECWYVNWIFYWWCLARIGWVLDR